MNANVSCLSFPVSFPVGWMNCRDIIYIILTNIRVRICTYVLFLVNLLAQSKKQRIFSAYSILPVFIIFFSFFTTLKGYNPFAQRNTELLPKGVLTLRPKGYEPFA